MKNKNISLEKVAEYLEKKSAPQNFYDIWDVFCVEIDIPKNTTEEKIMTKFYFSLINDKRFVTIGKNLWDLRKNQNSGDVDLNISAVYNEDDLFEEPDKALGEEIALDNIEEIVTLEDTKTEDIDINLDPEDDDDTDEEEIKKSIGMETESLQEDENEDGKEIAISLNDQNVSNFETDNEE